MVRARSSFCGQSGRARYSEAGLRIARSGGRAATRSRSPRVSASGACPWSAESERVPTGYSRSALRRTIGAVSARWREPIPGAVRAGAGLGPGRGRRRRPWTGAQIEGRPGGGTSVAWLSGRHTVPRFWWADDRPEPPAGPEHVHAGGRLAIAPRPRPTVLAGQRRGPGGPAGRVSGDHGGHHRHCGGVPTTSAGFPVPRPGVRRVPRKPRWARTSSRITGGQRPARRTALRSSGSGLAERGRQSWPDYIPRAMGSPAVAAGTSSE